MKDLVTPVAVDEIRNVVRKCLENAALINYTKVNEMARNDGQTLTHSLTLCAVSYTHLTLPTIYSV